jgi:hypothetical protein
MKGTRPFITHSASGAFQARASRGGIPGASECGRRA